MHVLLDAVLLVVSVLVSAEEAVPRPNFIVILSDDMGYSDIGCYGGEIETPNLDRLARGGLRFTQFYNTGRCCPTRASLLTGLYPHQAGIGHMMEDKGSRGYRGNLNRECRTMAEVLRTAGYRTYAVGKWHVTQHIAPEGPKKNWPRQRGFDRFYGMLSGAGSFFDPYSLCRNNKRISPFADPEYTPAVYYFTDAISDHAVRYLRDHDSGYNDRPFFMYVTYTAAHWPMHALPEDIAKYEGRYDAGYAAVRKARLEKGTRLGVMESYQGVSPQAGDWQSVPDKRWEAAGMEVYAAMVDRMDQGIGKIVTELERTGQLENTLVLYLQDNGGCAEGMGRRPRKGRLNGPRPSQATLAMVPDDALCDEMIPSQTRDGFPVRQGPKVMPGAADTYIGYGKAWANVSNTPFREYKHWVHEGGISTPLVAHWPAGIGTRGEIRRQPSHLIDIAATLYDLAEAKYPQAALPLEGVSLRAAFNNEPFQRAAIYWEHEGNRAVRVGNWKLVAKHNEPWELYRIDRDRTESDDLARDYKLKVRELEALYGAWSRRTHVEPWPVGGKQGR